MESADDVKFGNRFAVAGGCSLKRLFERHGVRAGSVFPAPECAEAARGNTNVRGIDMPVYVEVSFIAVHSLAHVIGQPTDRQNVAGAI